jgi:hypothetical protein
MIHKIRKNYRHAPERMQLARAITATTRPNTGLSATMVETNSRYCRMGKESYTQEIKENSPD